MEDAGLCYPSCDLGYTGVGPVCWLAGISGTAICESLYDSSLARAAMATNQATTFGIGVGITAGANESAEAGVVYGEQGQFGCYTTTCMGAVTDVAVNAWGAFDTFNAYADVAGDSFLISVGASEYVGGSTGEITTQSGQIVGMMNSVSVGVGVSPIQVGFNACHTSVTNLW